MKRKVTIQVPVEKRGLFGMKRTVYEERTVVVDERTYRRIMRAKDDADLDDFLDYMEEMDLIDELFDEM